MDDTQYKFKDDGDSQTTTDKAVVNNTDVPLNGNVLGTCKLQENSKLNLTKWQAIIELRKCNYLTSFTEIADYLEIIFGKWEENPNNWTYLSQYYTPKSMLSVINEMIKTRNRGALPLDCPGAYFTRTLKRWHKPRKKFRKENYYKKGDVDVT